MKKKNTKSKLYAIPRIENLTQKRGKRLTELLKLFLVEEGELLSSGSGVVTTARTRTGPTGQVCLTFYSSYSSQFTDRATIQTPTMSGALQCLLSLVWATRWTTWCRRWTTRRR